MSNTAMSASGNADYDKNIRYLKLDIEKQKEIPLHWFQEIEQLPKETGESLRNSLNSLKIEELEKVKLEKHFLELLRAKFTNIKMPEGFVMHLDGSQITADSLEINTKLYGEVSGGSHTDIPICMTGKNRIVTAVPGVIELKRSDVTLNDVRQGVNYVVSIVMPSLLRVQGVLKPGIFLVLSPGGCCACRLSPPAFFSPKPYKLEYFQFQLFEFQENFSKKVISDNCLKLFDGFLRNAISQIPSDLINKSEPAQGSEGVLEGGGGVKTRSNTTSTFSVKLTDSLFGTGVPDVDDFIHPGIKLSTSRVKSTLAHGALMFCSAKQLQMIVEKLTEMDFKSLVLTPDPSVSVVKVVSAYYGIHLNKLGMGNSLLTFLKILLNKQATINNWSDDGVLWWSILDAAEKNSLRKLLKDNEGTLLDIFKYLEELSRVNDHYTHTTIVERGGSSISVAFLNTKTICDFKKN
eukprot:GHVR01160175.1.p1 GENE.GHVR01160175.1~~GHVR01160175.1.p1  ORF type:complete len:463 (-),score=38.76 GHVR01160175.1:22-1410(-)